MAVLNDIFDTFLENIEPSTKAVKYAIKAHESVRDHLESDEIFKENVTNTFLYGSYKRHTAVGDIKDVDIVVLTNFDINDQKNTPQNVLRKLKDSLTKIYKDPENPEYQRRSIRINDPLPEDENIQMTLDIIPAVPITTNDGVLWVPDREVKKWVKSHPKGHIEHTIALNSEEYSQGKFVPLVKIIKWWWKYQSGQLLPNEERPKPKGFWIECLVGENFNPNYKSWAELFIATLSNISSKYPDHTNIPMLVDPGIFDQIIETSITPKDFKIFMSSVVDSLSKAQIALLEPNESKSSKIWNEIFGDEFPLYEEDTKSVTPQNILLGDTRHALPVPWHFIQKYRVSINAYVYIKIGKTLKKLSGLNSDGRQLNDGLLLRYIANTNASKPYEIKWQVVNTGQQAANDNGLRGNFFNSKLTNNLPSPNQLVNWEHTKYTGKHWIECFVLKDGLCVARSGKFFVNIKNQKY